MNSSTPLHYLQRKEQECNGLTHQAFAEDNAVQNDRSRFIEIVETELMSLNEGNIARYRSKLSEFGEWKNNR